MHIIKIETDYKDKNIAEITNESLVQDFLKNCDDNKYGYLLEKIIYSEEALHIYLKDFVSNVEYNYVSNLLVKIFQKLNSQSIRTGFEYKTSIINEDIINHDKRYLYLLNIQCARNTGATDEACLSFIKNVLSSKTVEKSFNVYPSIWSVDNVIKYVGELLFVNDPGCVNLLCIDKKIIYGWRISEYFADIISVIEKITSSFVFKKLNVIEETKFDVNLTIDKLPRQNTVKYYCDHNYTLIQNKTLH